MPLLIKSPEYTKWDLVSVGEVMLRLEKVMKGGGARVDR